MRQILRRMVQMALPNKGRPVSIFLRSLFRCTKLRRTISISAQPSGIYVWRRVGYVLASHSDAALLFEHRHVESLRSMAAAINLRSPSINARRDTRMTKSCLSVVYADPAGIGNLPGTQALLGLTGKTSTGHTKVLKATSRKPEPQMSQSPILR